MNTLESPREQERSELLTATAAAEYLGLSTGYFHTHIKRQLPHVQITPACRRFRRSDLDTWAAERTVVPAG